MKPIWEHAVVSLLEEHHKKTKADICSQSLGRVEQVSTLFSAVLMSRCIISFPEPIILNLQCKWVQSHMGTYTVAAGGK